MSAVCLHLWFDFGPPGGARARPLSANSPDDRRPRDTLRPSGATQLPAGALFPLISPIFIDYSFSFSWQQYLLSLFCSRANETRN